MTEPVEPPAAKPAKTERPAKPPEKAKSPAARRIKSVVATGRGDDGTTGLLYGGPRVDKDDPRTEAYGTIDEAVAALGLARAELASKAQYGALGPGLEAMPGLILKLQRDLFVAGAELATAPAARNRLVDGETRVSAAMVDELTTMIVELESRIDMPREFVIPGETRTSAALELARTIIRRAERRVVGLGRADLLPDGHLLPYLNRLADLVWVLARAAEQAETRTSTRLRTDTPTENDSRRSRWTARSTRPRTGSTEATGNR